MRVSKNTQKKKIENNPIKMNLRELALRLNIEQYTLKFCLWMVPSFKIWTVSHLPFKSMNTVLHNVSPTCLWTLDHIKAEGHVVTLTKPQIILMGSEMGSHMTAVWSSSENAVNIEKLDVSHHPNEVNLTAISQIK